MDLMQIPRMIDISAVRTDVTLKDVDKVIQMVKQERFMKYLSYHYEQYDR